MPEEAAFWGRTAAYGVAIAIVYWFVSHDLTGTILLGMFGVATGVVWLLVWRRLRRARSEPGPDAEAAGEAIPLRSLAPLWVGAGLTLLGLGLVYGLWFAIAALLPLGIGGLEWLAASRRELDLVTRVGSTPPGHP